MVLLVTLGEVPNWKGKLVDAGGGTVGFDVEGTVNEKPVELEDATPNPANPENFGVGAGCHAQSQKEAFVRTCCGHHAPLV